MACKTWEAHEYARQKCRDMYPDNEFMQNVASIIAMEAIIAYTRKLGELRKKHKTDSTVQEGK